MTTDSVAVILARKTRNRPKCIDCKKRAEAGEYHDRCRPCYARWLTAGQGEGARMVAQKQWECQGCRKPIRPGTVYHPALRASGRYHSERVAVCTHCAWAGRG